MAHTKRSVSVPQLSARDHERDLGAKAVKSARRVFELIELFEQLGKPATVSEIVQLSGFPQSSASMLLQTLHRMGYLCWNPDDRTYMPSLRLNMLGGWVHDIALPRSNLRLAMQELGRRTQVDVLLGQCSGRFVQYAHGVFSDPEYKYSVPIGIVRPLIETGLGYVLMSVMPDEQVRRIAAMYFATQQSVLHAVRDPDEVLSMVNKVRKLGFAYSTRLQHVDRASFSFSLNQAGTVNQEFSSLGLALAGKRRTLEACLPNIIVVINEVAQEFLPDVSIRMDPDAPIQTI